MDSGKTLEVRLLGNDSVVTRCAVLLLCTCGVVYTLHMWCCVHVVHVVLCTHCAGGAMYM